MTCPQPDRHDPRTFCSVLLYWMITFTQSTEWHGHYLVAENKWRIDKKRVRCCHDCTTRSRASIQHIYSLFELFKFLSMPKYFRRYAELGIVDYEQLRRDTGPSNIERDAMLFPQSPSTASPVVDHKISTGINRRMGLTSLRQVAPLPAEGKSYSWTISSRSQNAIKDFSRPSKPLALSEANLRRHSQETSKEESMLSATSQPHKISLLILRVALTTLSKCLTCCKILLATT